MIFVKRVSPGARVPTRAHQTDAGLDLYAAEGAAVAPGTVTLVPTGIAVAIPEGFVGLVWPRSGLACKGGVSVEAGVIDAGYRGEVKVALSVVGEDPHLIQPGDKIAQLLVQPVSTCEPIQVDELPDADRGERGFGSTDGKEDDELEQAEAAGRIEGGESARRAMVSRLRAILLGYQTHSGLVGAIENLVETEDPDREMRDQLTTGEGECNRKRDSKGRYTNG